ncbi:MAG: CatA-like O-acetyltransferase [Rikenellaceae bacterium]
MAKQRVEMESWKRRKKFEFFVAMANPTISFTVRMDLDNCYRAAKSRGRSLFIYYSYALIKAINDIEELRLRVQREDGEVVVNAYDSVDLVTPITVGEDGEFIEVRIAYSTDFEEFYQRAEAIIGSASAGGDPIIEHVADGTFAVVSAMPFLDFSSAQFTLSELGGVNQEPLIGVGKISNVNGHRSAPVAICIHHWLVDGFQIGRFYEIAQQTLDSYNLT